MHTSESHLAISALDWRWRLLTRAVALGIVLAAFGLRVWQIDTQSLWHDEGLSWWFAREPLWQMLRGVAGTEHPPLYFLALGVWMRLAGESAYALRFFSVIGGVLTVAGVVAVTRRWRWSGAGLLAALFLAWSPFHIWYSQEVRSYTWVSALALWLVYAGWRWEQQRRRRDGITYGAISGLSLYVHPFLVFLLLAHGLLLAGQQWRRGRDLRLTGRVLWPFLLGGGLFLPWVLPTLGQLQTNRTYWYWGYLDVPRVVEATAQALAFYPLPPALMPLYVPRITFFLWGLALVGSAWAWRWRSGRWLILSLWLPLLLTLTLAYFVPKYAPRYVIYTLPFWLLLVLLPVVTLAQWTRDLKVPLVACMAGTFLALLITGHGLASWQVRELTMRPEAARPNFRDSVGFVQQKAQPGDAVLLVGGHMEPIVRYYLRRNDVVLYPLPPRLLLDLGKPLHWQDVAPVFNRVTAHHPRLWSIFWQEDLADPQRFVYGLMQSYMCPLITPALSPAVDVGLYLVPRPLHLPTRPTPRYSTGIHFRNGLELVGFNAVRLFPPHTSVDFCLKVRREPQKGVRVAAGESLYVVAFFRPGRPLSDGLTGFVHLVSNNGQKAFALSDRLLGGYAYPVWRWQVGEVVRQAFLLRVPRDLPPGRYALEMGLYHPRTLQRVDPLPARVGGARVDGSRILYGPVDVLPPWQ